MPSRFASVEEMTAEFWRVWQENGVEALLDRYQDFFIEDAVWSPPVSQVAGHDYVGRAGFAEYVRDFHDAFKSFGGSIQDVEHVGPDEHLASNLVRTTVRVSAELTAGGRIDASLIAISRLRDGRIAYAWGGYDPEAAAQKLAELQAGQETADA